MTAFVIPAADLHEAAGWASRIIPSRPAVPVMGGLILDARDDGSLTISGYDFDTAVSVTVPVIVTSAGRSLVSGKLLAGVAAAASKAKGDVRFAADAATATVTAGRSEWSLPLMPVEDYPRLPELGAAVGAIEAGSLRRAIGRALTAAGKDDTLPMLTGVRIESDAETLTFTATDRFRVATTDVEWKPAGDDPVGVLVPASLLDQAARAVGYDSDMVGIYAGDGGFGVASDTHSVIGRLLDVQFPQWRRLIPDGRDRYAMLNVSALSRAVEQVMAMADGQIVVEFDGADATVTAGGDDRGRARAVASLHELVGEPMTAAFNPVFLRDALAGLGADRAMCVLGSTSNRPVLFLPDGDDSYKHLLMPVRLPG